MSFCQQKRRSDRIVHTAVKDYEVGGFLINPSSSHLARLCLINNVRFYIQMISTGYKNSLSTNFSKEPGRRFQCLVFHTFHISCHQSFTSGSQVVHSLNLTFIFDLQCLSHFFLIVEFFMQFQNKAFKSLL